MSAYDTLKDPKVIVYEDLIRAFRKPVCEFNRAQRAKLLLELQPRLFDLIPNINFLKNFLILPLDQFNIAERASVWLALRPKIGDFNPIINHLGWLLGFHRLTPEQVEESLVELESSLPDLVGSMYDLQFLLALPLEQFDVGQRAALWVRLNPKLPSLIQTVNDFVFLLKLPIEQLDDGQKEHIWKTLWPLLDALIQSMCDLNQLFGLPMRQFDAGQRVELFGKLEQRLVDLIQSAYDLSQLFQFSFGVFSVRHREVVWMRVRSRLSEFFKVKGAILDLVALFKLSTEQLSADQKMDIWQAVRPLLDREFIKRMEDLIALFELSFEQLNALQRQEIWQAVKFRLSHLLKRGVDDLIPMAKLPVEKFNDEKREALLYAVRLQLPHLIRNAFDLHYLEELLQRYEPDLWNLLIRFPTLLNRAYDGPGKCPVDLHGNDKTQFSILTSAGLTVPQIRDVLSDDEHSIERKLSILMTLLVTYPVILELVSLNETVRTAICTLAKPLVKGCPSLEFLAKILLEPICFKYLSADHERLVLLCRAIEHSSETSFTTREISLKTIRQLLYSVRIEQETAGPQHPPGTAAACVWATARGGSTTSEATVASKATG